MVCRMAYLKIKNLAAKIGNKTSLKNKSLLP